VRSSVLVVVLALVTGASGCATGRSARGAEARAGSPDAALRAFAAALRDGRFEAAHELLSARWRAAYTPRRLAADLAGAGPAGQEAAQRAVSALEAGAPVVREGDRARVPLGGDRAAVLVLEGNRWKVDALE
jgi:hypothetical protein